MEESSSFIDISLYIGYILTVVAVVAAILLPLFKSLDNPKSLLKVAGGVIGVIAIFGLGYALSDSTVMPGLEEFSEDTFKYVGASLVTMYILLILAVAGIAVTEVAKFFR